MRALLLAVAITAGCRSPGEASASRLRVAVWGPLQPLEPVAGVSFTNLAQDWVFEPLARIDAEGRLGPALAASVSRIDPRRFRIALRRDVRFSDGSVLTSEDAVQALESQGLKATPDGEELIVEPSSEGRPVEALLSRVLVAHKAGGKLLGSGPFAVAEQDREHVVLVRRQRKPHFVNEVALLSFANPKDAFIRTLKGDADLVLIFDPRWIEFFEGVPRFKIARGRGNHTTVISFNPRLSRADRLRLARILASSTVRKSAYGNNCEEQGGPATDGRVGSRLDLLVAPGHERLALAARRALGPEGGDLVSSEDFEHYFERMPEYPLSTASALTWPRSMLALSFHSRSPENRLHYDNPAVDAAFDESAWAKAERLLAEDPPVAFVCTLDRVAVVDARVKNPVLGDYGFLDKLPDWELGE